MTALPSITNQRLPYVGSVLSAFVLILLAWQVSFKVSASDHVYLTVEQNIVPVFDVNLEEHDFDWVIPVSSSINTAIYGNDETFSVIRSGYFHLRSIPQSRAPPNTL